MKINVPIIMTMPVCRDTSIQTKQHTAQLQQQMDSAQADLGKAASQLKQQQVAKDGLEQQLQQVSGQLAAQQQENTQVRTQPLCLLRKSLAAEPVSDTKAHFGTLASAHAQCGEQGWFCMRLGSNCMYAT